MDRKTTGQYVPITVAGEEVKAFIPSPLPPNPPIEFTGELLGAMDKALLALGRLDSLTMLLPDPNLFLYSYVRREAVYSSQIEGTQSTLDDLLLFELDALPGVPIDDVTEVSNYVMALDHGMQRLESGFPLSSRLIREMHAKLMSGSRGSQKAPGEFRRSQNWIGGTRPGNARFVPPPANSVDECVTNLEHFIHDENAGYSTLIKAGIVHVQFETIHPFLDGNGRVGRLLIPFMLYSNNVLSKPSLYLSLFFKQHRTQYYDLLDRVRTHGDWEACVRTLS